ncbi:DUF2490 domain-containing protein [Olleya marilimosa]|uniref:DUF2490 domain-containing protein n=2 Tax=Olleya marilimosa TaxID=272164 RepID=A0ABR8LRV3_9FLAO|nr:DUF2490 domain-containing protein [Olleya marilimosa]MBD3890453.1 DUF2490 domain-containing protein [Olleya marilimosa]|tara:strand:+ start:216 stop:899 length:684 start_codon:yes stop_codon:yes gene_type:complete
MKILKMRRNKIIATLTFMLVLPFYGLSQNSDLGNWLIYIGSKELKNGWNIHNEVQYRNYDAVGDLEQLLLRTGLGYNLTENNNNLLLGYGYILSENYVGETDQKVSVNEHRIFQQFTTKQKVGVLNLSHRYRFEQRFVEDDFKMRFRYFLGLKIPLQNKADGNNPLYLSAYNEIFLNTKSEIFDRNRLYGGLGYQFSKQLRLELGYMNQFFETSGRDQINIMAFVNF